VIDYQLQKNKIYPLIAKSYAMTFAGQRIREIVNENYSRVKNSDYSLMKEVHILLCGGKGMYTQWHNEGVISLIQACGGHGLMASSGFEKLISLNFPNVILEGENTILLLQVARELLKSMEMASRGENQKLIGSLKYLSQIEVHNNYKAPEKREDYRQVGTYISIFSRIVCMLVQKGGMKMMTCLGEGVKARDAFDQKIGITIVDAAKVHTVLFTLRFFDKKVRSIGEGPVKLALSRLALLYAIDQLFVYCKQGLETDTLNNTIVSICGEVYEELLEQIHPDALNLIEGYGFPDDMIRSSIGHSNGKPYENLYTVAKNNGLLNTFDVHPAMLTYIKNQYAGREHEQEESSAKPKL
jgi:hypothetical protein